MRCVKNCFYSTRYIKSTWKLEQAEESWSKQAITDCKTLCLMKTLKVKSFLPATDDDQPGEIELCLPTSPEYESYGRTTLADVLVFQGMAYYTGDRPERVAPYPYLHPSFDLDKTSVVRAAHVESPSCLYVQPIFRRRDLSRFGDYGGQAKVTFFKMHVVFRYILVYIVINFTGIPRRRFKDKDRERYKVLDEYSTPTAQEKILCLLHFYTAQDSHILKLNILTRQKF